MEQKYPLTKQQEGLWVEWRLHPDNTSYNTCVKLKLNGALDEKRFIQALRDAVDFFSSLRVYFTEENGVPYQRIKERGDLILTYEDVSVPGQDEESPEQEAQAKAFLEQQLRTPVDLKTFPIVRAGIIKTAPETHYLIGLVPHMISDGSSAVLFLEAASIAYNKGRKGMEEAYAEGVKDWGDYFAEAEAAHSAEKTAEAAAYWQNRMDGAQHTVDFSYGQQDAGNDHKTGKRVYFNLDTDLSQSLKDYSRRQRTTLFSTLVAAYGTLLNHYYGQDDILIGYPVNIRPPGYKYLFGFFVNIIPIRVDLSGDPTFEALVGRISAARKADKKHQTFPALDIVREIRKNIAGFDGRVFNVSMAQTVSRLVNLQLDGVVSEPLEADYNDVNDDLSLSYELLEDGRIGLWLEYREVLFTADFAQQMIEHMHGLLQQIAEAPEKKISAYKLLQEAEYPQFLQEWSAAEREAGAALDDSIHGLIEDCAEGNPEAVALVHQGAEISYAQMNARANQLARYIQAQGTVKGDKVALCLRRGPEMIIALLAVMKAGCAYVPIPPCYPKERLAFILSDAQCAVVVTQSALREDFAGLDAPVYVVIDEREGDLADLAGDNLDVPVAGGDAAYVIYTSGSTGQPKGVLLTHGNVTPRLVWLQGEMGLEQSDIVLQNTDYSFDVSVAEIFWPLTAGARLILTESAHYKDPSYLIDLIEEHGVTTTCFVPSLLSSLLAVLKDRTLTSLKRVLAAGEALPPTLVQVFYEKCGGDLYNVYGPTEGAIYAAYHLCARAEYAGSVPIGRPIGETTLYILDRHNRPQPVGVAGELYIGGAGVAQGYLNREALSAEKFIADPFSDVRGARLYRTGDLCRFGADGVIEYLGRMDAQVKIRGFRIELAEIETVIAGFDGVADVAVIDYGAKGEHKRLVAYYVCGEGVAEIDVEGIKAYIAEKLPEYMAPAFYSAIEAVPRLASGKINRRALPAPESLMKKRAAYAPPESVIEKQLVEIWAGILKVPADKIGIHDSFFDIGGDSLMAIQFVCEAEEQGIVFETDALFTNKSVAGLARIAGDTPKVKIVAEQDAVEGQYPLLPRQAKFFGDGFKQPDYWNRFFFFEIDHDVDAAKLRAAFDRVLAHHDNLRVFFTRGDDGVWQQNCRADLPEAAYVFSHDVSGLTVSAQDAEIVRLTNEQHRALSLGAPPLIRVVHFKTGREAGKLSVILHHLLLDMVSSRLIFEDLMKVYEGLRHNIEFPLPAKTTSAKDWAEHLIAQADGADFSEALGYWASPSMAPRPKVRQDYDVDTAYESSAAQEILVLDRGVTAALLKDIPASFGINIQDFLLGCLLEAMAEWTGDDSLLVNVCGHGRSGGQGFDLSRTVGWVNTVYPIYLERHGAMKDGNAATFMRGVQSQIEAVPVQNGHYNLLRYNLGNPEVNAYSTPEIFFNYVSQLDALLPDDLSFQPVPAPLEIQSSHEENHLCYLLYMEAAVMNKRLNVHITYSDAVFKTQSMEAFTQIFKDTITRHVDGLLNEEKALYVSG